MDYNSEQERLFPFFFSGGEMEGWIIFHNLVTIVFFFFLILRSRKFSKIPFFNLSVFLSILSL